MKCKNCEINDAVKYSKYSTGEFCCRECARAYSTKEKRKEINEKVSETLKAKKVKKIINYICEKCNKSFEVEKSIKKGRHIYCNECKRKVLRTKDLTNVNSIFECSNRTVHKLIKRAKIKCPMCGWDKTSLDLHHIINKKNGGSNDNSNLIPLCPNCHRMAHENKYSSEELTISNLDIIFSNWKDFYNNIL